MGLVGAENRTVCPLPDPLQQIIAFDVQFLGYDQISPLINEDLARLINVFQGLGRQAIQCCDSPNTLSVEYRQREPILKSLLEYFHFDRLSIRGGDQHTFVSKNKSVGWYKSLLKVTNKNGTSNFFHV